MTLSSWPWVQAALALLIAVVSQGRLSAVSLDAEHPRDSQTPPAIPYRVLTLAIGAFGSNDLDLTQEQRTRIREIQSSNVLHPMIISRLRLATGVHYSNQGLLERAIKLVEQKADDRAASQILDVLSAEQIQKFRTKHRGAIQRQMSERLSDELPELTSPPTTLYQIGVLLQNCDLLTLLEGSDALDAIQLTDSQYSEIRRIRKEAWPLANAMIRDCYEVIRSSEDARRQSQRTPAPVNPALVKLMDQTLQVLSAQQQEDYRHAVSKLHQELTRKLAENPAAMAELMTLHQAHGQPVEIRTEHHDGKSVIHVRLHNFFAVPDHAQSLKVTDEQQLRIAELLSTAEKESAEWMQQAQAGSQQNDAEVSKSVYEKVTAYHRVSFDAVMAVLSNDQKTVLRDLRLRQIGVESLRLAEIQSELGLSDSQREEVVTILNRPMASPDATMVVSAAESQKRLSHIPKTPEEARQRFEEQRKEFEAQNAAREKSFRKFSQQRHREIWQVLTPPQQQQFKTLTGLADPPSGV